MLYNTDWCFIFQDIVQVCSNICPIRYRGAISRSAVAWTASSIVLCIGHSKTCWQMGRQTLEQTWTICWKMKPQCY